MTNQRINESTKEANDDFEGQGGVRLFVYSHKEVMQMDPDLGDLTEELALVWQMGIDRQSVPSAHFLFDSGMF